MKRILIIDDEDVIRSLIQELYADSQHVIEHARDGEDGIARAEASPPSLVITDLLLPRCHGYEVIRRLRAFPGTAAVPIIVLSAKVYPADIKKALALGADVFIEKPFNLEELSNAIEKCCARSL